MTTQARFDTKGLSAYLEAIQKAGLDIDLAAADALMDGGEILQTEMRALVPIDEGDLMNHIQIKGPTREGNVTTIEVGVIHDLAFTDADTAKKGNAQEYGWISGGKFHKGKSYIRAAIEVKKSAVMKAIRESLKARGFVS
ncbi:MAG: HK97 gp10 family phage protein [Chloroflexi bacterium]|nr:HK97 gp10 family phage protein [Chloroflexota bacterium]